MHSGIDRTERAFERQRQSIAPTLNTYPSQVLLRVGVLKQQHNRMAVVPPTRFGRGDIADLVFAQDLCVNLRVLHTIPYSFRGALCLNHETQHVPLSL